ncbi:MAG: hypothetical protein CV080_05855 [Candidatus Kuenenia stuttgartiensis]|nr:MAG: hypothetical protein CV080_05855 [Candidatus Kuenenia stuttgartiensis]
MQGPFSLCRQCFRSQRGKNTYCPNCRHILVRRAGYRILENHIEDNKCKDCETVMPGIWS